MPRNASLMLKVALMVGGSVVGLVCAMLALEIYARVQNKLHPGSSFESLSDLRTQMLRAAPHSGPGGSVDLREIIYPHPDDHIIYDLRPNLEVNFQKVPVRTNSCGMRNPEVSIAKPEGVFRIALLGDSFAFGWGVREDEIFARVLERSLNRRAAPGRRFEVLNFGVPGYSTFQEVYKFLESGADFDPDAILVYFINNDFGYPFMVRDMSRPGKLLSGLEFARLTWRAIDPEVEQQKMFLQGVDPNSALTVLSDYARQHAIDLSVAINPYKKWPAEQWRLSIFRKRPDVNLIDLGPPLREVIAARKIPLETLKLPTDPHPSALKHDLIGEVLAAHYLRYVR